MANEPFLFGAAASGVKFLFHWMNSGRRPHVAELVGHVSRIKLYPVKSMGGIMLDSAECTYVGLKHPDAKLLDRSWMVTYGETDRFVTARQEPKLLCIKTSLHDNSLHLDLDSMQTLSLPLDQITSSSVVKVIKVFGEDVECVDCGDEAADWISQALGNKPGHRLVFYNYKHPIRLAGSEKRLQHIGDRLTKSSDMMTFNDDGPFLLVTDASMRDLNDKMSEQLDVETFRPTITVSGVKEPFDEDTWKEVYIGDVKFTVMMFCSRCILTTLDAKNGTKRDSDEPLKTLKSYRKISKTANGPIFGVYLVCDRLGKIHHNDPVYITRTTNKN